MKREFLDLKNINPEFKKIIEGVGQGKSCSIFGAVESLKVALSNTFNKKILYITSDIIQGRKLQEFFEHIDKGSTTVYPAMPDSMVYKSYVSNEPYIERNTTLFDILCDKKKVVITSADALTNIIAPKELFCSLIFNIQSGDDIERDNLVKKLISAGYRRSDLISAPGEFAVRGDIVDIYELSSLRAVRVEMWDTVIEKISEFDIESNKTGKVITNISICPSTMIFGDTTRVIEKLEKLKYGKFENAESEQSFSNIISEIITKIETNDKSYSLECILPLLGFKSSLIDYLDPNEWLIVYDEAKMIYDSLLAKTRECEEREKTLKSKACLMAENSFIKLDELLLKTKSFTKVAFQKITSQNRLFEPELVGTIKSNPTLKYVHSHTEFAKHVKSLIFHGHKVFIFAGSVENAKALKNTLENFDVFLDIRKTATMADSESAIIPEEYGVGFTIPNEKIVVFGNYDLYAKKTQSKKYSASRTTVFSVPKLGDYVVHSFHGIGICEGVTKLESKFGAKDYVVVRYRDNDKLFVPIDQMNQLEKFTGGERPTKLSKIGGAEFAKVKEKVKEGVKKIAFNLLALYAEREKLKGYAFPSDDNLQLEFENSFPFTETEDQLSSLSEIKSDMQSGKVMDRLLCGDVGYGKTEVALRASFKAVIAGKQVAFIAPTTILSQQHYNTAMSRMKEFGVNIEVLNRFKTPKQVASIISKLRKGEIDIICGTHRLLSKDVEFKDLGLIVLDEEQKFGVADKEKLKLNHKNVDVLTLSATPIPRTLHMSLSGIRDVSIISTPPSIRLPIETYVTEYSDNLVFDAVTREMRRGGQVFILYNNVEKIYSMAARIKDIVKDAKILVGHGQMSGKELEDVIYKFYNNEADILICTTIIENGIDIENANTLIVIDSDKFGLSQLYQIRGRVGRGNRLGYAYFTYNKDKVLTEEAYKRLEAISEFTEFGSGFKLAMKDLEIRGGGNIFGAEQHGHMQKVGYDMYSKLLSEAVDELRGVEKQKESNTLVKINVDAYIPDTYILSSEDRMTAYKNIGSIIDNKSLQSISAALVGAFGKLPKPTENLLKISYMRALGAKCKIKEIVSSDGEISLIFENDEKIIGNEKIGDALYAFRARCVLDLSKDQSIKFNKLDSIDQNIDEILEFLELLVKIYE